MHRYTSPLLNLIISASLVLSVNAARADDTEIFNITATSPANPNILFILDTSGSMTSAVLTSVPYSSSTTYTGACTSTNVYYEKGSTNPTCGSAATRRTPAIPASPSFTATYLQCDAANAGLSSSGHYGGTGAGDDGIRWTTVVKAVSSVNTPSATKKTRTNTDSYTTTTITTQVYHITGTKVGTAAETFGAASAFGAVITVSTVNGPTTTVNGAYGASTTAPTGAPATTTPISSTTTSSWSTELTPPTNTNTNGSPAVTATGAATSTSVNGAWVNGTVTSSSVDGARTVVPAPPTNPTVTTSRGVTTTKTVYQFTRTTTTQTPHTRSDVETSTTPATSAVTNTSITYTATDVECDGDKTSGSSANGYPNVTGSEWTSSSGSSYWTNGGGLQEYNFYSGNYLNYLQNPPTTNEGSRIQVMQNAFKNLIGSISNVNVGLMRYSNNNNLSGDTSAQGGMVTYPVTPLSPSVVTDLDNTIDTYSANGYTPLSETLYEAYLYYSGGSVNFGVNSTDGCTQNHSGTWICNPVPSVAGSRVGNTLAATRYQSPIQTACQKNYIVYLTDGLPTQDNQADSLITGLPNFATDGGGCDDTTKAPYGSGWGPSTSAGKCLAALSQYMNHHDMSSGITGSQGVATYFIGLGSDFLDADGQLGDAFAYLQAAATRGGGTAYSATDSVQLSGVLTKIVNDAILRNTSFSAPTVAVNAFNRTTSLNDLYISVFQPSPNMHWPGNVKKYHLINNALTDQYGNPAVDPATGFFYHSSKSFWTHGDPDGANLGLSNGDPDGDSVPAGGAAHNLPGPGSRKIYTYISSTTHPASAVDLTSSVDYTVNAPNSLVTATLLGNAALTASQRVDLINWARGQDIDDTTNPSTPAGDNPNGSQTDARNVMGDPVHARPAVVIYGGTSTDPDTVVFVPTNDGYLHAIGGKDADGVELWSFIPQELLPDLNALHLNAPTSSKHYSLDGDVTIIKYDINGDGVVDPAAGDKVIAVVGQGRGGSHYYALDVTDKNTPKFMWSDTTSDLPGLGQTWSAPVLARVKVSSALQKSKQKFVLIFGGGYDTTEETAVWHAADSVGNHIFMIDVLTGKKLWSAGPSGSDNLSLSRMDHAIPGSINVIDLDGDGFADRMYAADLAGQVWRFDITNSQPPSTLVAGGVIASLGVHDATTHTTEVDDRRFFNEPDVALVTPANSAPYFSVSLGSGYRSHPLNTDTTDRFYSIRDKSPYTTLTQSAYDATSRIILQDGDLTDITNNLTPNLNPVTTNGWKLTLVSGEKVLSSSVTFQGDLLFTTYLPGTSSIISANGCNQTSIGTNRVYAVNVADGSPLKQQGQDYSHSCATNACTTADRYDVLAQGGIAPGVVVLFYAGAEGSNSSNGSSSSSSSCSSAGGCSAPPPPNSCVGTNPTFIVGPEVTFAPANCTRFKTYWKGN